VVITLDQINRVTLREMFLPMIRNLCADFLLPDWNPSDEELERLAARVSHAFREQDEGP